MYLARDSGEQPGEIAWQFDLEGTGLAIEDVTIVATAKCFENGRVEWTCQVDGQPSNALPVTESKEGCRCGGKICSVKG